MSALDHNNNNNNSNTNNYGIDVREESKSKSVAEVVLGVSQGRGGASYSNESQSAGWPLSWMVSSRSGRKVVDRRPVQSDRRWREGLSQLRTSGSGS